MRSRFEIHIPPDRRAALDALAAELGITSSALVRIGVGWVLQHREMLVAGPPVVTRQAEQRRAVSA
jgi:hypothetical protein